MNYLLIDKGNMPKVIPFGCEKNLIIKFIYPTDTEPIISDAEKKSYDLFEPNDMSHPI